jgi:hypothetical protein
LKEISDLLERKSQSLTNPDTVVKGPPPESSSHESALTTAEVTIAPSTPELTVTPVDRSIHNFYCRSVAMPSLVVRLRSDNVDTYEEKHGYGHAETQGPAFGYDRAEDDGSDNRAGQPSDQPSPVSPAVSTSTIFEPISSSSSPIVSLRPKNQIFTAPEDRKGKVHTGMAAMERDGLTAACLMATVSVKIMKREDGNEWASHGIDNAVETSERVNFGTEIDGDPAYPATSPSRSRSDDQIHEKPSEIAPRKPVSYAAAVRTSPNTPSKDAELAAEAPSTSQNSPAPDLGFTLEPLPKPTIQQVQSKQQPLQLQPPSNRIQASSAPFNFAEWRQRKIADGSWEDRSNNRPLNIHPPHPRPGPFHPTYRGRGGGGGGGGRYHHHENFHPGGMSADEHKQNWFAWKDNLINQGKWNPHHSFRAAWKNE